MIRYQFKVKLYDEREYIQDVYINFNLKKELQNLLYSIEPYTDKIQNNISEYTKIIEK